MGFRLGKALPGFETASERMVLAGGWDATWCQRHSKAYLDSTGIQWVLVTAQLREPLLGDLDRRQEASIGCEF